MPVSGSTPASTCAPPSPPSSSSAPPLGGAGANGLRVSGETARRRDQHPRPAHPPGAADRPLRRPGSHQPRGRSPALPEPADDRLPPSASLHQARHPPAPSSSRSRVDDRVNGAPRAGVARGFGPRPSRRRLRTGEFTDPSRRPGCDPARRTLGRVGAPIPPGRAKPARGHPAATGRRPHGHHRRATRLPTNRPGSRRAFAARRRRRRLRRAATCLGTLRPAVSGWLLAAVGLVAVFTVSLSLTGTAPCRGDRAVDDRVVRWLSGLRSGWLAMPCRWRRSRQLAGLKTLAWCIVVP